MREKLEESPLNADDWWARVEDKHAVARLMVDNRQSCREAWHAAGTAVEFALKAIIMDRNKLNGWPSRSACEEVHTHDLRKLMRIAQLDPRQAPPPPRASLRQALDWDRGHDYQAGKMQRAVARSMVDSVFGEGKVIEWLKSLRTPR